MKQKVKRKTSKKKEKRVEALGASPLLPEQINVCNVTAGGLSGLHGFGGLGSFGDFDGLGGLQTDTSENVMDCLEEMANAQIESQGEPSSSSASAAPPTSSTPSTQSTTIPISADKSAEAGVASESKIRPLPPPPPPGLHRIPNIKIELSRHFHVQSLSSFLLQQKPPFATHGQSGKVVKMEIRMPTFERWLLDSKLEEWDRLESLCNEMKVNLSLNPSLAWNFFNGGSAMSSMNSDGKKKKKYGRAKLYSDKQQNSDARDAYKERETNRKEKEIKLLADAIKFKSESFKTEANFHNLISNTRDAWGLDPILPWRPLERDPSSLRLVDEIVSALSTDSDDTNNEPQQQKQQQHRQYAMQIVRELCDRSSEASNQLHLLEVRLGKYQKFAWDATEILAAGCSGVAGSDGRSKNKKRKRNGGIGGGDSNTDKVHVEWHSSSSGDAGKMNDVKEKGSGKNEVDEDDRRVCSLIYIAKKRKSSNSHFNSNEEETAGVEESENAYKNDKQKSNASNTHKGPKPFVIKLNAIHYYKLRAMFDTAYNLPPSSPNMGNNSRSSYTSTTHLTPNLAPSRTTQITHTFHFLLFATLLRYSSLSGGQQLVDWRGGGMQGAIHEGVFDCLERWFGTSASTSTDNINNTSNSKSSTTSSDNTNISCGTECFASPFNSKLLRYYSAFPSPDVDGHLGSFGNFFHPPHASFLRPGWYEVNPPFSPGIMSKMALRIKELMSAACHQRMEVTFVIVVPTCKDENPLSSAVNTAASTSFQTLVQSPHCLTHTILPPREHGYIEGSQHLRPTRFKESQYSTSVIVLSSVKSMKSVRSERNGESVRISKSEKGAWNEMSGMSEKKYGGSCGSTDGVCGGSGKEWNEAAFERELREAFASLHALEVEERKSSVDNDGRGDNFPGNGDRGKSNGIDDMEERREELYPQKTGKGCGRVKKSERKMRKEGGERRKKKRKKHNGSQ